MFIEDNNLYTYQDGQPTFFHPNGHVQAEIDYILTNYSANELLSHVTNEGIHHDNVSDHVPLSTEINSRTQLRNPVISTQPKPRWEKCNKEAYQNTLISYFATIKSAMFRNINEDISELMRVLVTAVQKSIPGSNQLSKKRNQNPIFGETLKLYQKRVNGPGGHGKQTEQLLILKKPILGRYERLHTKTETNSQTPGCSKK